MKLTLLPPIGAWLIRMIGRTLRLDVQKSGEAFETVRGQRSVIVAFWHDQQLMMPLFYHGPGASVLISRHRDGELIARIASRFGLEAVRGSTSRGGAVALRRLVELGRSARDLIVTPDGPRGPRHTAQRGAVYLAKATGLPIVPVAVAYSKKKPSPVGTTSSCRCRSAGAPFWSASRYRSSQKRRMRNLTRSARSSRTPSTGSRCWRRSRVRQIDDWVIE